MSSEDEDEHYIKIPPTELVFINITDKKIIKRMPYDYFEVSEHGEALGKLLWNDQAQCFVIASKEKGLSVVSLENDVLYKKETMPQCLSEKAWGGFSGSALWWALFDLDLK